MGIPDSNATSTHNITNLMAEEATINPRVLIVDDDGDIRRLIRIVLERDGCIVTEVENGDDGLVSFSTNPPDLVLLDYLLPGMNGGDICKLLREMPGADNIPIIMLTALDDPKTIEACFAAGATDFITKPIHRVVFRHRVRKLIQLKKTQDRLMSQTQVLRQMHGELMQSRKLYRTLVEKLPNGAVFLFDQELRVSICGGELLPTLANRARTAFSPEEHTPLEDYFPAHTRDGIRSFSEAALHGQSARFTYEFSHERRSFIAHAYPVRDESGVVFAGVVIVQDITDMKHAEQLLRDNQQQLEQLVEQRTEELRQANQSLQWEVKGRQQVQIELQYRMQVERLISSISTRLLSEGTVELENSIQAALQAVGEFADADRTYVFQLSGDGLLLFNRFEWTSGAVEPQIHLWQSIPAALFRWLISSFSQNRVMMIDHPERLPFEAAAEAKFMDKRTVGSSIIVAMTFEDKLTGFLGIDSISPDYNWPDNLPTLLKIVAELFATALEHKRTEEALRSSEKKLRQITDTMLDAVYQTDGHGVVEYASPSCWQVFGYRPEDFVQTLVYSYVHPEDVDRVRKAIQTTGSAEYRFRRSDDTYIWVETLTNLLFDGNDGVEGIVFASRDITERKRAERELEELNRLKTEFLSTAAHELRTPLTSIRGFSEILITRQMQPERQQHYLKMVNEQATNLGKLIDDLLDISRLEAKRGMTMMLEQLDLAALTRALVLTFVEAASNHSFTFSGLENEPTVLGDRMRLSQVIQNLLSNAVKYSPNGGQVEISLTQPDPAHLQVSISDQGMGMTNEQMQHLFEKFYRADASNTAIGGTGLGLAISKLIIELHGGEIGVHSQFGQGSTFYFTVPIANESKSSETSIGNEHSVDSVLATKVNTK